MWKHGDGRATPLAELRSGTMDETFIRYFVFAVIPMLVFTGVLVIVAAIGVYVVARQIRPISFFKSLACSWLVVGFGALVFVSLVMMSALSSGAYDPIRDDGMTPEYVPWLWYRLWFFVVFYLLVSIPIVGLLLWPSRPTRHGRSTESPSL